MEWSVLRKHVVLTDLMGQRHDYIDLYIMWFNMPTKVSPHLAGDRRFHEYFQLMS